MDPSVGDAAIRHRCFAKCASHRNKLPFHRTRHLRNAFNDNREVKISRDGTEVEPTTGDMLLKLFWQDT